MSGRPGWLEQGAPRLPSDWLAIWLIGRRAALEALRDRVTVAMSMAISIVLPIFVVGTGIRLAAAGSAMSPRDLGSILATYLLITGLLPSAAAVGITAGQFAGEKEQGNLTPLLASPA